MGIKTNLVVSLDEDVVGGDSCVLNFKTTDAGNIVVESTVNKVAIKLSDLEEAIKELRQFFTSRKHIDIVANSSQVVPDNNPIIFEYNAAE